MRPYVKDYFDNEYNRLHNLLGADPAWLDEEMRMSIDGEIIS